MTSFFPTLTVFTSFRIRLKEPECFLDQVAPELTLYFWCKGRVAEDMRNGPSRQNAFRPSVLRYRNKIGNVDGRDSRSLDLFYHRCAAASAGSSSRGKDNPIDPISSEFSSDLTRHTDRDLGICPVAGRGVKGLVESTEGLLVHKVSQDIHR